MEWKYNYLEQGDIREALNAVGDDQIQEQQMGYATSDTFAQVKSGQRKNWFYRGFITGVLEDGDTFNTEDL